MGPMQSRAARRVAYLGRTIGAGTFMNNTDPAFAVAKATTDAQLNHVDNGQVWVQNAIKAGATAAQLAPLYQWYSMVPQVAAAAGQAQTAPTPASQGAAAVFAGNTNVTLLPGNIVHLTTPGAATADSAAAPAPGLATSSPGATPSASSSSASSGGFWASASTGEKVAIVGGAAVIGLVVFLAMKKRGRR